ncbi:coiled-coil domain-containing protein 174 [Drosophila bipectinata]|uniref:coiled-coil domain-containing protein 174 n=1 Tax=Drosophila bipectinata TaxID=42026 RepID=UPI001C899289|nr:coiled-coil domain-containing protein 174 [Drosophila bipectinata]
MNDPNKKISVNLSSLLSLKAELLRKQHEVKLAKATKVTASEFRPIKMTTEKEKLKSKNPDYKKIGTSEDGSKVYEAEDTLELERSRRVLEAKSKYYERMSRSGGSLNSDDHCLVMFNRKKQEEGQEVRSQRYSPHRTPSRSSSEDEGDDDDEVEYIDCLGRTRKCQRKDLAEAKRRDEELGRTMPQRLDQSKANWMIDTQGTKNDEDKDEEPSYGPPAPESICSDAVSTMTKHDEQRMNWEIKEQENFEKPDVHYQDVFFDEARTHGVGYYAFSTDEAERKQQQAELEEARKATAEGQKRRDEMRAKRDSIVTDRVLAAKNRIRARDGLPPISKEEFEKEQLLKKQEEMAEKDRERKEREKQEALDQEKAKQEAELDELRKEHVRDWDRNKPGVATRSKSESSEEEWKYKAERFPLSQEAWNEKQRALRQEEFAPMSEPKRTNFSSMPPPPAWVRGETQEFRNFHTSKQERSFQRRNYNGSSEEMNDDEPSTSSRQMGAAIPPPAGLNDNASLPPAAKRPKSQAELERSIEAGLKFLRENCDKGALGNKATWTAKADY